MTPPPSGWLERVLRRLVRLFPADFRGDFGDAIEADLAERHRSGDRRGLLLRDTPSLLTTLVREHADVLAQDVRSGGRSLARSPGFTATAILMLSLGVGVNVAVFSVIDAVSLRSPFHEPERIVSLAFYGEEPRLLRMLGLPEDAAVSFTSVERVEAMRTAPGPFASIGALTGGSRVVTGIGDPRGIDVECVTPSLFEVLGSAPRLGRVLVEADARPDGPPVVVLSHWFWQRLGGSPDLLGRTLRFDDAPAVVIGVMPADYAGAFSRSDVAAWLPIYAGGGSALGCAGDRVQVFARLSDGISPAAAGDSLSGVAFSSLLAVEEGLYGTRARFLALAGAVVCVLLIACVNVGGLQLERALARRREMAVRLALGASRGRLVRQALTENLILAAVAAAAGVAGAYLALPWIVSLLPAHLPRLDQIVINGRVLAVATLAAGGATVLASLLPLARLRRFSLTPGSDLASTSSRTSQPARSWGRRLLVSVEVALSVVVLVSAGLAIQTFMALRPTEPGFDPDGKQSLLVRLPGETPDVSRLIFASLFDGLRASPGISQLAGATYLPMRGVCWCRDVDVAGIEVAGVQHIHVTPTYFDLMRVPMLGGRAFTAADAAGAEPVVVVNEAFARRIDPQGGSVLGRVIPIAMRSLRGNPLVDRRIVGIAGDMRARAGRLGSVPDVFIPYAQDSTDRMWIIAQSASGQAEPAVASALQAAVRELRADVVVEDVESMTAMLAGGLASWRFPAWLLGIFAALSVFLASTGLATTVGWWVRQRTRELGIRAALGATRRDAARLVLRQGMPMAVTGIAVGCGIAVGTTRLLANQLYGVTPLDPATFAGAATGMLCVAALAIYLPTRRATRVDPVEVLRAE